MWREEEEGEGEEEKVCTRLTFSCPCQPHQTGGERKRPVDAVA